MGYETVLTYNVNAEGETEKKEKQVKMKGVGKSSAVRIVVPSATERRPDSFSQHIQNQRTHFDTYVVIITNCGRDN